MYTEQHMSGGYDSPVYPSIIIIIVVSDSSTPCGGYMFSVSIGWSTLQVVS